MGVHAPPPRKELKDRYLCRRCPECREENHILVTYDAPQSHSREQGQCWNCGAVVHEEDCFLVWTGRSRGAVERYAGQAARLRRAL